MFTPINIFIKKTILCASNGQIVTTMAKKNICESGKLGDKFRLKSPKSDVSQHEKVLNTPIRVPSPDNNRSPRTSPGLLAGHYAGCKWTEPPLPSALPLPPQHWMQPTSHSILMPFHHQSEQCDIANQLKVLLKVQA